ncbi:acyltransferase family protein [Ruegeria meonggei]|uniref:acyltransferase family protein n=1 Tax=Ruegeria meonggei TaxID=1446476 RepID=UPI00366CDA3C
MKASATNISPKETARFIADRTDGRDNNFNLIRILAASGVLVSHAYPISWGGSAPQPLENLLHGLTLGTVCVWVFFAISGFFITRSFDRQPSIVSFLTARILRLYPALATVLVVTILVAGFVLTYANPSVFWAATGEYFVRNMLLFDLLYGLPGVFETNPGGAGINGSLWSLSYEVTCYAGVFICGLLGLLGNRKVFAGLVLLFLCIYAATMVLDLNTRIEQLAKLGLTFLTGMVFYIWRNKIPLSWGMLAGMTAVTVASWFTPLFMPVFAVGLSYTVFFAGYAKVPLLLRYNRLGDYSYGVYIYAFPIQQMVAQSGVTTPAINMAISLPFTLICAILSWHLIEAPAMKLRHRIKAPARIKAKPVIK